MNPIVDVAVWMDTDTLGSSGAEKFVKPWPHVSKGRLP